MFQLIPEKSAQKFYNMPKEHQKFEILKKI